MKKLIIELTKEDLENIEFILPEIATAIEEGFTRGIEFPVNWHLQKEDNPS